MSTRQYWQRIPQVVKILFVGFIAVCAVVVLRPTPKPKPVERPLIPEVPVVVVTPVAHKLPVTTQGTVTPRREIDLVAQVAGKVDSTATNFVDGGFFVNGERLINIDSRDYEFALVRAEARVKEAEQALATERGRVRQAKREWRDLGNEEANELFLRKPQLASARAMLASARADRDQAQLNLKRTGISVPFSGRVRETYVDVGQYVSPGTKVAKVYDTSVAEVRLPLTDRQIALIDLPLGFRGNEKRAGPEVKINGTIAGKRYQWHGNIVRTDASLDTRSRLYYAVAEVIDPFVSNPGSAQVPLVVGLFVEAEISGREISDVVRLPKEALFKRDQLYTVDENNRVQLKTVELLYRDDQYAWVRGNLMAGDRVIIGQQSYLATGMVVAVHKAL